MVIFSAKNAMSIVISSLLILLSYSVVSVQADNDSGLAETKHSDQPETAESALDTARLKLESAIDRYKKGDMVNTRQDLEDAIEWLNKASRDSLTDASRAASLKLGGKIDAFTEKFNQASAEHENSLLRFWHESIAIIGRETDRLIKSYTDLATSEKTLKYLLDAKMHLFTAEHDLLVSHNSEDSVQELDKVLENLATAQQLAIEPVQNKIMALSKDLNTLKEKVKQSQQAWQDNDEILFLNQATDRLMQAKETASADIKLRIQSIEAEIQSLRTDIERINIKNNYEASMQTLRDIIAEL